MLYYPRKDFKKYDLCSFCAKLCELRVFGQKAKMEAGENPARSRHCKEGAFSDHVGMSCKVQDIFIKPLRTRQISRKRSYPLGRQGNVLSAESGDMHRLTICCVGRMRTNWNKQKTQKKRSVVFWFSFHGAAVFLYKQSQARMKAEDLLR